MTSDRAGSNRFGVPEGIRAQGLLLRGAFIRIANQQVPLQQNSSALTASFGERSRADGAANRRGGCIGALFMCLIDRHGRVL